MSITIRLARFGKKNSPSYKVVLAQTRDKRNGNFIDTLGFYNPTTVPAQFSLDKEKYKDLRPEWIRALVICLGFLREPWGNKVPQLLRSMANDLSLGDLCEDIKTQAAQFNRENFNKGHHRLERRRVDDVKRYLARTSRLVGRNHKQ